MRSASDTMTKLRRLVLVIATIFPICAIAVLFPSFGDVFCKAQAPVYVAKMGSISGCIVSLDSPCDLSYAVVEAIPMFGPDMVYPTSRTPTVKTAAVINESGEFAIGNLPGGSYYLRIQIPTECPQLASNKMPLVFLEEGENLAGLEWCYEVGACATLRVQDFAGNPIPDAHVWISGGALHADDSFPTRADGTLVIGGLSERRGQLR